jgi:NADH dehydrogenase
MPASAAKVSETKRIVILGGGYGGAYCAQRLLRRLGRRDADVWVIDRHNYFVFYPLLVEAGTGGLEPRHVVVPIRDFLPGGEFRMARVVAVDVAGRTVDYRMTGDNADRRVTFDHLVIALGSATRYPDVPGAREHGRQIKSLTDAVALRDRAIQMLELANATEDRELRREMLTWVVVGGNFTGVEVAGEFDEFFKRASRRYRHVSASDCRMVLVEMAERILAPLGEDLSDFAAQHLRGRGIDVRLKSTVQASDAHGVTLSDGTRIPARTVIWCAGIEPSPLLKELDLPRDERGYIICERDLSVRDASGVWAVGDCAVNVDAGGAAYPATAQHAVRQGMHLADNLLAALDGRSTKPCDLTTQGSLAALGCRTGVARVFGLKISGFAAWWLWRTVYLLKMPRLSRKLRIALDWTIDLLFSRDYVQLGVHGSEPSAVSHQPSAVGHQQQSARRKAESS